MVLPEQKTKPTKNTETPKWQNDHLKEVSFNTQLVAPDGYQEITLGDIRQNL